MQRAIDLSNNPNIARQRTKHERHLNGVVRLLLDSGRWGVLERRGVILAHVIALARSFDLALLSFLSADGRCGASRLVRSNKAGGVRTYRVAPKSLQAAKYWIADQYAV